MRYEHSELLCKASDTIWATFACSVNVTNKEEKEGVVVIYNDEKEKVLNLFLKAQMFNCTPLFKYMKNSKYSNKIVAEKIAITSIFIFLYVNIIIGVLFF